MTDLEKSAQRLLEAWDTTPLFKAGDGMLQERFEVLRDALEKPEQATVKESLTTGEQPEQEPGSVCARCGGWVCDPVIPQPKQPPTDPRVAVVPNPDGTWTPCFPMSPYPRGCRVCGMGADGQPVGYVCPRSDCPSRISCGGGA